MIQLSKQCNITSHLKSRENKLPCSDAEKKRGAGEFKPYAFKEFINCVRL